MVFPALLDAGKDAALRDRPSCIIVYVYLLGQLDFHEYRTKTVFAVSHTLGMREHTAGLALRTLVERGYLDAGPQRNNGNHRQARAYRLVWSRPAHTSVDDADHTETDIAEQRTA